MAKNPAPSPTSGLTSRPRCAAAGRFGSFVGLSKRVSPTCLISFEHEEDQETVQWTVSPTQGYSVPASFAKRPVSLRIYPDRLVVAAEGNILCEHARVLQRSHRELQLRLTLCRRHCAGKATGLSLSFSRTTRNFADSVMLAL